MEENMKNLLLEQPFFQEMDPAFVEACAGCASLVQFEPQEMIFREGEQAQHFYVLRRGRVSLYLESPGREHLIIQTLGETEIIGWSWLIPPHKWTFNAQALELTRAIALDTRCILGLCESKPDLGYRLVMRFARIMAERLQATRMQLIDLYEVPKH